MFKHQLNRDLNPNFFNEFAKKINFTGIRLKAILSETEFSKKYRNRNNDTGLVKTGVVVSLKKRDLPRGLEIKAGEKVSINEKPYTVIKSSMGEIIIKLDLECLEE